MKYSRKDKTYMTIQYNLSQLKNLYIEACKSSDKTLIFENQIGNGRFLFMMFLSDEDKESKDILFIYLRNTRYILKIKMYGNHNKGIFEIYVNDHIKNKLINELQLTCTRGNFDFLKFLNQLNSKIPLAMTIQEKVNKLRENRDTISSLNVVDDNKKTVLIGEKRLPSNKSPKDKTLRKLYMYTEGDHKDVATLITLLKKFNMTVSWTTEDKKSNAKDIRKIVSELS